MGKSSFGMLLSKKMVTYKLMNKQIDVGHTQKATNTKSIEVSRVEKHLSGPDRIQLPTKGKQATGISISIALESSQMERLGCITVTHLFVITACLVGSAKFLHFNYKPDVIVNLLFFIANFIQLFESFYGNLKSTIVHFLRENVSSSCKNQLQIL